MKKEKEKTTIQQQSMLFIISVPNLASVPLQNLVANKLCAMHKFSHSNFRNYAGVTEFPNYTKITCDLQWKCNVKPVQFAMWSILIITYTQISQPWHPYREYRKTGWKQALFPPMLQSREKNCMQPTANKNTVKPVQLGLWLILSHWPLQSIKSALTHVDFVISMSLYKVFTNCQN